MPSLRGLAHPLQLYFASPFPRGRSTARPTTIVSSPQPKAPRRTPDQPVDATLNLPSQKSPQLWGPSQSTSHGDQNCPPAKRNNNAPQQHCKTWMSNLTNLTFCPRALCAASQEALHQPPLPTNRNKHQYPNPAGSGYEFRHFD
jgi:hypothetical protein